MQRGDQLASEEEKKKRNERMRTDMCVDTTSNNR